MNASQILKILFVSIFLFWGCDKEEADLRLPDLEIPVITGFEVRTDCGDVYLTYGIPNIKLGNEPNINESEYYFFCYPNPCSNECAIYTKSPNPNRQKSLWVVQALYEGSSLNSDYLAGNTFYAGGMPLLQSEFTKDQVMLDLSSFPSGYYRVYLKIGGYTFYDNLVIAK